MTVHYEQDQAVKLLNAMSAAMASLAATGDSSSMRCVERALDELDTKAAAEIARMMERRGSGERPFNTCPGCPTPGYGPGTCFCD